MLPLQGAQIWSLVSELRSHMVKGQQFFVCEKEFHSSEAFKKTIPQFWGSSSPTCSQYFHLYSFTGSLWSGAGNWGSYRLCLCLLAWLTQLSVVKLRFESRAVEVYTLLFASPGSTFSSGFKSGMYQRTQDWVLILADIFTASWRR